MELQEFWRNTWQTSFVFIGLLLFTRFLGKTQVAQLTFYEYISGITIGSIAGNIAAAEPDKFFSHFYDLALFVLLTYLVALVSLKSRRLRKLIEGSPTVIIENGRILRGNMRSLRYDLDELNAQLRQQGILDVSEVQFAVFETTGELSIIKNPGAQPITKNDLNIPTGPAKFPVELIMDGEIITENLQRKNLSDDWLHTQLALRGVKNQKDVLYAVVDSNGHLFISLVKEEFLPETP